MRASREAIIATLDLLVEMADEASLTVPVEDFATWLAVLNSNGFYLVKSADDQLYAFESGGCHRGKRVHVDTHPASIVGHEVPAPEEGKSSSHLVLPITEAANLRAGDR